MKALSLISPWAELVVLGEKQIELRKWNTKFRGEFLVHSSKSIDENACKQFEEIGYRHGIIIGALRGAILGKAELVGVKKYNRLDDLVADKPKHFADSYITDFKPGKVYGFILQNASRFETPIAAKGALNFWEYEGEVPEK